MNTFTHFCPEHIVMLAVIAVAITTGLLLIRRISEKTAAVTAVILSVITLMGEAFQDVLLIKEGGNIINFLPLHLCNLGIFVNLLAALTRGRLQSFFAEVSLVLIAPGSAAALLFPDWTYRPFWSSVSMLCFFTHTLLVFVPLMFLIRKKTHVSFKHFWYPYAFFAFAVPPVYILNVKEGLNYMYLMHPPENSPLEWIYNITGSSHYIQGLFILITVILAIEYSLYTFFDVHFHRKIAG